MPPPEAETPVTPAGTFGNLPAITHRMTGTPGENEAGDAELMRRTAEGDRDAFALLYRRFQGTVFRFARLMTGSSTVAEDVVQEVFLALMRDAARYDPARAGLSTYVYGIARHVTRRRLMRERRFVRLEAGTTGARLAATPSPDEELLRRGELAQLRRAILRLPSRYREVLVLCDLQDVPYAEAAALLACPIGTVRSRRHRARTQLAASLRRAATPQAPTMDRPVRPVRYAI